MDMKKMEMNKKEMSLKSMYFNRFLLIRYGAALFLFANLYWFVLLVGVGNLLAILPCSLFLLVSWLSVEQVKQLSNHQSALPKAKLFFRSQLTANLFVLMGIFTPAFPLLYPFLSATNQAKILSALCLIVGVLVCLAILQRIKKIESNKDIHYQRVIDYQTIIK